MILTESETRQFEAFFKFLQDFFANSNVVVCLNMDCENRRIDGFSCNCKKIVLDKDGKCRSYVKNNKEIPK